MDKVKVLVVEDNQRWQDTFARKFGQDFQLLQATTIEQGEELFLANPDIGIVVMDACVPGDDPNTMNLVKKIRETFVGKMIASSSVKDYREILMAAGCSHQCPKNDLFEKFPELANA
ncbi:MAG: hypothetical protein HYV54_02220 [Parcubacteria group bacterium]|nr:hypothetical protein [Parcubacteria group bacterium]